MTKTETAIATINDRMSTEAIDVPASATAMDAALSYLATANYDYPVALEVEVGNGGKESIIADSRGSVRSGDGGNYREFLSIWLEQ